MMLNCSANNRKIHISSIGMLLLAFQCILRVFRVKACILCMFMSIFYNILMPRSSDLLDHGFSSDYNIFVEVLSRCEK